MFSKCANPECSTPFDDERGRFFRFHKSQLDGDPPANCHSVQHLWLCQRCSEIYTLEYRKGRGVFLVNRPSHAARLVAAA